MTSIEQAKQRQRVRQIYLFAGKIEQALDNIKLVEDKDLQEKLRLLQNQVIKLRNILNPAVMRQRLENSIESVSRVVEKYAKMLNLEHAEENIRLNIKDLTIEFKRTSGRTDFLWEVGSGQNWVGYHIAALLSIHEYISANKGNPVPSFLLIDQPSQVYFPESSWGSIDDAPNVSKGKDLSADIIGVQRIFSAISAFMEKIGQSFQVIVTEHAGSITWKDAKNIHVVGNWRKGADEFLIPSSWLADPESSASADPELKQ